MPMNNTEKNKNINKTQKLKMNITGSFHALWSRLFFNKKLRDLHVNVESVKHCNIHHTEIVLSGDKENLWKALKSAKTPSYFLKMDRIVFEFFD